MKSDVLDELDRKILQALHLDARAPFSKIAAVLEVSDQTIARRFARMQSAGQIRVIGLLDPVRLGQLEWIVRIRCKPQSSSEVAAFLARRPDTSWISRTAGGTELVCVTTAPSTADELLLHALPRSAHVLDVTAHCVLHTFCGRSGGMVTKLDVLSDQQIGFLAPRSRAQDDAMVQLDDLDRRLVAELEMDGRMQVSRLAERLNEPATTVQHRIEALRSAQALYFDVDTRRSALGVHVRTLIWLTASPSHVESVGQALASDPQIAFAAAISGSQNLYASVATDSALDFYRYLTERAASIPGLQQLESTLVLQTIKTSPGHIPPHQSSLTHSVPLRGRLPFS